MEKKDTSKCTYIRPSSQTELLVRNENQNTCDTTEMKEAGSLGLKTLRERKPQLKKATAKTTLFNLAGQWPEAKQ